MLRCFSTVNEAVCTLKYCKNLYKGILFSLEMASIWPLTTWLICRQWNDPSRQPNPHNCHDVQCLHYCSFFLFVCFFLFFFAKSELYSYVQWYNVQYLRAYLPFWLFEVCSILYKVDYDLKHCIQTMDVWVILPLELHFEACIVSQSFNWCE